MENLKFSYIPNSTITLKITSTNIVKFHDDLLLNNIYSYEYNENGVYNYLLKLSFRPCVKGEIYREQSNMLILH